ncbi:Ger(x)C family spore germination protein [Aquibacillus salsiterrae]|uniref:Ger(X)C family spore germination protein n=1 Tax=Aquibacillus salsiterrae TaxID=2950439 RepID=A0A9X4AFB1_9BACI|nr:Ger(x)C family spore germination protein [Aquibacillus salsiterrae]MDC3415868.1 Ger(x)C family spore germination protein [Aquibacillus salsiterrae]
MRKKLVLILFFLVLLPVLSGCWDKKELNELAILTGLAIDQAEEGYRVTAQILNPAEIAGEAQTNRVAVSTYEATGDSLFEAIRKITDSSPRKLYLAHLRIVVLGKQLAEQGIEDTLDFLSRDHEVRTDFFLLVSEEKDASSILKVLTPIDKIPTNKLYQSIESSQKNWAPTLGVKLDQLISTLISEGNNPVLTGVYIEGDTEFGGSLQNVERIPSPSLLKLQNLAAFKGDKLVGWLTESESKAYNYLTDNVTNTVAVQSCTGGNVTIEINNSATDIKVVEENGQPKVKVTLTSEAAIGEVQCENQFLDERTINELEASFAKKKEKMSLDTIETAKKWQTDIFGFGEKIYQQKPKLWQRVKENWDEEGFVNLEVDVKAEFNIKRTGTIGESFQSDGED